MGVRFILFLSFSVILFGGETRICIMQIVKILMRHRIFAASEQIKNNRIIAATANTFQQLAIVVSHFFTYSLFGSVLLR